MANIDIRTAIKDSGMKHWQVADLLGVSEATFVRKLRKELNVAEKEIIFNILENRR